MSVSRAQKEIDSREFAEWLAFDRVEPQGEFRADLRAGIIAAVIANVNRGRGTPAFKPADFMPDFDQPAQPDSEAVGAKLRAALKGMNRAHARPRSR